MQFFLYDTILYGVTKTQYIIFQIMESFIIIVMTLQQQKFTINLSENSKLTDHKKSVKFFRQFLFSKFL